MWLVFRAYFGHALRLLAAFRLLCHDTDSAPSFRPSHGMRVRRVTRQGIATFETPQRRLSHAKHGMRFCLYQIALADVHRSRLVYCRHLARFVNPTSQTSRIFLTGPLYKIISFAPATSFPEDEKLRDGGWGRTVSNNLNAKSKVPTRNRSRPAKYVRM